MPRNTNPNRYYVYALLDPRDFNKPFYIGKGCGNRRYGTLSGCSNKFKGAVIRKIRSVNQEPVVFIWQRDMREEEALLLERELIKRFGLRCEGTGILTNLTYGGEGSGVVTESTRKRMAERMRGTGSPTYGVGHTPEARTKMSASHRRRVKEFGPNRHSEQHKQKLRVDNPGGKATARPIYQIGLDGMVIQEWPSSKTAGEAIGIRYCNIANNAKDGSHKAAGGFRWRWATSKEVVDGTLINNAEYETLRTKPANRRVVRQIDLLGTVVREWSSVREAASELGVAYAALWSACKYGRVYAGFMWQPV